MASRLSFSPILLLLLAAAPVLGQPARSSIASAQLDSANNPQLKPFPLSSFSGGADAMPARSHGQSRTVLYNVWKAIRGRCNNPNYSTFQHYGGRGITVCEEWSNYENFHAWAMGHGWKPGLHVDRFPDQNGPYSPDNCRIATRSQNHRNTRVNRIIEAFGEKKCLAEWIDDPRCVVNYMTLFNRVHTHGWPAEEAITTAAMGPDRWARWRQMQGVV